MAFNWIKKHWIIVLLFTFLVVLGVPLGIHLLFKIQPRVSFFSAEWSAGDALTYYGSVLSFIGTVVLGALALYQNRLIKVEADKRAAILEEKEHEKNMPKFVATSRSCNGNCSNLHFDIKNISENAATEIIVFDIHISSGDGRQLWTSSRSYSFASIPANNQVEVKLNNITVQDGSIFSMQMQCRDKYNELHQYSITGIYFIKNNFPRFTITEIR